MRPPTSPPGRPPAERRQRNCVAPSRRADDGQHAAQRRAPDDDAVPQRLIEAQRREVEPVRDGAHPGQRAAAARRQHRDLGRAGRDVQLRAGPVVDLELVERQRAAVGQGPLVGPGQRPRVPQPLLRQAAEAAGHGAGVRPADGVEALARVGEDRRLVEAIGGPVHHHQQRGALGPPPDAGAVHGLGGRQPHPRQVEVGQPLEPQLGREPRHVARVHHDDAGGEPDHEQQAERNPQVAVNEDEPLAQQRHRVPHDTPAARPWPEPAFPAAGSAV